MTLTTRVAFGRLCLSSRGSSISERLYERTYVERQIAGMFEF